MPIYDHSSRDELRRMYLAAWRKHRDRRLLEPLEAQIVEVIIEHPEYHALLDDADTALSADFGPDTQGNPFMHMGMHLAVRDQVNLDRPTGIRDAFTALMRRKGKLTAEHIVAEVLADALYSAQQSGRAPDEQVYLRRVQRLAR
jgi:hypothetical protein